MTKIMILGAGPFQLPAIKKAVESGYWVATADHTPENIGHKHSHCSINCSTRDREGILQAARNFQVDGICTFSSDVAVPTVGYVCDELRLNGVSEPVAEMMSNKTAFRSFQRRAGLPHPRFVSGSDLAALLPSLVELSFPLIVKPTDTSGSRGITRVERYDADSLTVAFHSAKNESHAGEVCLEEFLPGIEVGGDGMLRDGSIEYIAITHKHLDKFTVIGHSLPANISSIDQLRITDALDYCCSLLGYTDGPLNFDVMISNDTVTVIEMSARNGGNGIPAVVLCATGLDMENMTLQFAVGNPLPTLQPYKKSRFCGSMVFGSDKPGVVRAIPDKAQLTSHVPNLRDLFLRVQPGETVEAYNHNGNMLGYAIFEYDDPADYERIAARLKEALQLKVD